MYLRDVKAIHHPIYPFQLYHKDRWLLSLDNNFYEMYDTYIQIGPYPINRPHNKLFLMKATTADACTRGMGDNLKKQYDRYVVVDDKTVGKEVLCDTETLGGGWIVIQVRARLHNRRIKMENPTLSTCSVKERVNIELRTFFTCMAWRD